MRATAEAREGGGADLRVRGGDPLVEPKTRTAEALLPGVMAGLHSFAQRSNPPAPLLPVCASGCRHGVGVSSSPRSLSPITDQLLPAIHAIVISSLSLLRVARLAAALRGNPWIDHLATVRTESHRRISTSMIHVGTQTLCHELLSLTSRRSPWSAGLFGPSQDPRGLDALVHQLPEWIAELQARHDRARAPREAQIAPRAAPSRLLPSLAFEVAG